MFKLIFLSKSVAMIMLVAAVGGVTTDLQADTGSQDAYSKPGFVTRVEDGRLWIFREGSKDLKSFEEHGELAKQVVRPAAGPGGITLKAPDAETLDAYLLAKPGSTTIGEDGKP